MGQKGSSYPGSPRESSVPSQRVQESVDECIEARIFSLPKRSFAWIFVKDRPRGRFNTSNKRNRTNLLALSLRVQARALEFSSPSEASLLRVARPSGRFMTWVSKALSDDLLLPSSRPLLGRRKRGGADGWTPQRKGREGGRTGARTWISPLSFAPSVLLVPTNHDPPTLPQTNLHARLPRRLS